MTRGVDGKTLATMRLIVALYFTDTCTIYRKTGETNTKGISKPTYDAGTSTPCGWSFKSGSKLTEGNAVADKGRVYAATIVKVELPPTTSLTVDDYIQFDNRKWQITFVPPIDALAVSLIVDVKELA